MAKLTLRSELNVGTELIIDEALKTFQLVELGNLIAKDGVTFQAVYGKFVDLWATPTYQDSPFPFNALDALSGQYLIGIDAGGNANGWAPADDATRNMIRDGGWEEYNSNGELNRVYAGVVGLGSINVGAQPYFQRTLIEAPQNFTYDDQANAGIQVYGTTANTPSDATAGDFDNRTFFKAFVREQGYKYSDSILADTGKTATGAYIVNMLLSNEVDNKITDLDDQMLLPPYDGVTVEYFATDQERLISGNPFQFRVIVSNTGAATLAQIYTKVQYFLRQNADIDTGAGSVIGQTADSLMYYDGDTLKTTLSVFIDNVSAAESNSVTFNDQSGVDRAYDYEAAGTLGFSTNLVHAGSSYRLMFTTGPGAGDDYGEAGALTVNDASGTPITGVITAGSIPFTFDWDNDTIGGPAATDKAVTLIGIAPGFGKFAVGLGSLTRTKTISVALVAETDRAYA